MREGKEDGWINGTVFKIRNFEIQVMLRINLSVAHGLVNGAVGTVHHIIYRNGCSPPSAPSCVMVRFENYSGPYVSGGLVPIRVGQFTSDDTTYMQNIPLTMAWALTIHKAQGTTLKNTYIDIGERERTLGLTYVALSRVRSLNELKMSTVPLGRFLEIGTHNETAQRRRFLSRLRNMSR